MICLNKAVELYTEFRRGNQFLSVQILLLTIQKCEALIKTGEPQEILETHEFIILILEDHEEFVKRHISIDAQFFLYHTYVSACVFFRNYTKLCSHSERVFPYLFAQLEEEGCDHFRKAKTLVTGVCKKIGKYSDGKKYYNEALMIWKESPPYAGCKDNSEFVLYRKAKEASILMSQADLALPRSIADQKKVTKEARRDSIYNWNEPSKLYQMIIDNTKPGHFFSSKKFRCHLLMAIQYGKLKQWDDAEEHFDRAIEIGRNDDSAEKIGMVRMWIGELYFDRYIHNSSTVGYDEQNEHDLTQARIQTLTASKIFKSHNLVSCLSIILDHAHQSYFLGDIHMAIGYVVSYVKRYMKISTGVYCNACNQTHSNREVKHYCRTCNATFYCNRVCQYQDWRGENEINVKHRLICPVIKSWNKLSKMRPEVEDIASQDIETVINNTKFEDMFKCYFESLRK